ncbi:hypothetical protein ACS0TY_018931 [Phlomoides rotata]
MEHRDTDFWGRWSWNRFPKRRGGLEMNHAGGMTNLQVVGVVQRGTKLQIYRRNKASINLKTSPEMSLSPEIGSKDFGCCKEVGGLEDFGESWSIVGSWAVAGNGFVVGDGATKKMDLIFFG